jgi:hypothetical protein
VLSCGEQLLKYLQLAPPVGGLHVAPAHVIALHKLKGALRRGSRQHLLNWKQFQTDRLPVHPSRGRNWSGSRSTTGLASIRRAHLASDGRWADGSRVGEELLDEAAPKLGRLENGEGGRRNPPIGPTSCAALLVGQRLGLGPGFCAASQLPQS